MVRAGFLVVAGLTLTQAAVAAETYVQPAAEVRAEVNSNRTLATTNKKTTEGYSANLATTFGIVTPRSDTTIQPEIGYIDYPKDKENSLQALLQLASNYHSPRSDFSVYGRFDSRDTYHSELASAVFNPLNPNDSTTPETGRLAIDTKRALASVNPSYKYSLTQRSVIGVSGIYQTTSYSGTNAASFTDYDYSLVNVFMGWVLNPRTQLNVGVFESRDKTKTAGDGVTNGTGVNASLTFNWTNKFTSRLELTSERDDFKQGQPSVVRNRSNNTGATYSTQWSGQVSKVQLDVGRTYTPSGFGGLYRADQIQVEYNRALSPRMSTDYAARYIRYSTIATQSNNSDYNYVTATAGLRWLASRTWYVSGGLEYFRVDNRTVTVSGNNTMIYASFGYRGLGRRP
jgi:hypothetical protein